MKKARQFAFLVGMILSALGTSARAEILTGWVTQIADGDTFTLTDYANQQHRVRLMGIDAPEKYQAYGGRAQQNLGALINGRDVAVEWSKRDQEGNIVGRVMVAPISSPCRSQRDCPKTQDVALEQVKAGQAWCRSAVGEPPQEYQSNCKRAEFDAKIHRNGLWADAVQMPPWDFKRNIR